MIDIEFGGGNLAQYYEHLQQRNGVRNIILASDDLAKFSMPEVMLSSVLFSDAVELPYFLTKAPDGQRIHMDTVGASHSIFVVGVQDNEEANRSDPMVKPISFDFEGGSLDDFIATVQEAAGTQNILLRGPSSEFEVLPLKMENVTLYGVLSALDGDERRTSNGQRVSINVDDRSGVFLVEVQADLQTRQSMESNRLQTVSWSLASIRSQDRLTTEQMLTAIEAAVEVSGAADTTTIRFHEETSLLIVSARSDAIQTIDGVLVHLQQSADATAAAEREAMKIRSQLQSAARALGSQMEYHAEVLEIQEARLDRLMEAFDAGNLSQDEVYEQRLAVLEAKASLQEAEAQLTQVKAQLEANN
jgi:hypothetical protein